MSLIPDDVIEQVREAADLVGIVGEHVELKRTGSDFRGPCPFHGGTHRNFAVIPKKGMFYCFVCHEAGDAFTFFMKRLGMDYPTAVREVARRVGITIPERGPSGPDPHEPLFNAVAAAADWFTRQLSGSPDAEVARTYLGSRGLELETVLPLGLGYAPKGKAFLEAMKGLGVHEDVLLEAGLLVRREDGTLPSRFHGRLLFPIHDSRARVVGFGGRILGDGEPKYLNSPETPIFHKGKLLYNLHVAKHAMRRAERAIVVEGYFDVLRLGLVGIDEVVATRGTARGSDHAGALHLPSGGSRGRAQGRPGAGNGKRETGSECGTHVSRFPCPVSRPSSRCREGSPAPAARGRTVACSRDRGRGSRGARIHPLPGSLRGRRSGRRALAERDVRARLRGAQRRRIGRARPRRAVRAGGPLDRGRAAGAPARGDRPPAPARESRGAGVVDCREAPCVRRAPQAESPLQDRCEEEKCTRNLSRCWRCRKRTRP